MNDRHKTGMTTKDRTVVLIDPHKGKMHGINWSTIGQVVSGVSHLYQIVKERDLDLILVAESHTDLTRGVATRIRRFNGLTEIWKITDDDSSYDIDQSWQDGVIPIGSGEDAIAEKVKQILHSKKLLQRYGIVARSARMKAIADNISKIGPTDVPVLIVGPSGSGKELVARAIHNESQRSEMPFVSVNCGAIAEGILDSELFGHEKGAFTGSVAKREGLFHKANGGTIFLDEIGETIAEMQVKLLRVLEDGTYYSVGSSVSQHADVRVLSATNRDLAEAIADRSFREDLYFRITVVKIVLPPLLERKGDIQPLLKYFWRAQSDLDYSDAALDLLIRYDWPGNVRQLKNFADRMAALRGKGMVDKTDVERFLEEQYTTAINLPVATGRTVEEAGQELIYRAILSLGNEVKLLRDLIVSHLPSESQVYESSNDSESISEGGSMEEMEKKLIEKMLADTKGNRKEAALKLQIGERTLYRKLNKYGLK